MKRHPALIPLSHDHHHGLILAQLCKKGSPEYKNLPKTTEEKRTYAINFYNTELTTHFREEEEILFPVVKGKDAEADSLIDEIISEHRKLEKLVKELESTGEPEDKLDEFGNLLEQHIRKEERVLFQDIQKLLTEDELDTIHEKINNDRNQ